MLGATLIGLAAATTLVRGAVPSQAYTWNNVHIGGGGGFVPGIIFNPTQKGLAYARTDIGGAYRLNADDSWTPLTDFANDTTWDYWGIDALATDPVEPDNLYLLVGEYTNSWDPDNGTILKSSDQGNSFTPIPLPFKVGGNMPGRGLGERLVIDPNNNKIIYLGARSGHGLWRSTDAGLTWSNITNFPSVGTYVQTPGDASGLGSDIFGIGWITFDVNSKTASGSSRIFVGVANMGADNVFVSEDAGATWSAVAGQNNEFIPHHGVLAPAENALYLPYANGIGPYDGTAGYVMKYFIGNSTWKNITPAQGIADNSYGYGGLAVDHLKPGTIMVAPLNEWYPDANIYRSTDGGNSYTQIFSFGYPPPNYVGTLTPYYTWDTSRAPWIVNFTGTDTKFIGWMIESLQIDPFDSDHWLYGTGLTLYGGRDLTNWDASPRKMVTVASLATGIEEMAVQDLTAVPRIGGAGPFLASAVSDVGGFVHTSLTVSPETYSNPNAPGSASGVDHAGSKPNIIFRVTAISGFASPSLAMSTDSGLNWAPYAGAPAASANVYGGKIAVSALGTTVLWTQATGFNGVMVSSNGAPFTSVKGLPSGSIIAADRQNDTIFYGASGPAVYVSIDSGKTFKQTSGLGSASTSTQIAVSPYTAGELYISSNVGIFHSTDFAASVQGLGGPTTGWSISVGAPKTSGGTPSLYAAATIGGVNALFRTDDVGGSWVKLTDGAHGLSTADGMVLAADVDVYSQIYVGTNGRGVFYGHAT